MIKLLIRFAAWMDARFPARLVVTQEIFDTLSARFHRQEKLTDSLRIVLDDEQVRVAALEKSVAALKDLIAKGGVTMIKTEADRLRDNFVRTGERG